MSAGIPLKSKILSDLSMDAQKNPSIEICLRTDIILSRQTTAYIYICLLLTISFGIHLPRGKTTHFYNKN